MNFNLASNNVTIDLPYELDSQVTILNAIGANAKSFTVENKKIVNLSDLAEGMYVIVVSYQNQIYKHKIIK